MSFFKLLLLILLIYLALRFISGLLFGSSARGSSSNDSKNHYADNRREGDVTLEYFEKDKKKKISKDEGEYISYEDLENK